jgi:hypothetical protein
MRPQKARQLVIFLLLAVLGFGAIRDLARVGNAVPWNSMFDFADFYCAGQALAAGKNPYTYEPLHTCEARAAVQDGPRKTPWLAIPAPQPPYALAAFAPLSRLDFATARRIGVLAILLALALTALLLVRLGAPPALAVIVFAAVAWQEVNAGQIVPYALLLLTASGYALARKHDALAGILATLTAIEPHLALPVVLTAFVFVPRARAAIALTAIALLGVALAAVGPEQLLEYFTRVVGAHASSEIAYRAQYSLTYVASALGAAPRLAMAVGDASYVALVAIALTLAPRMAAALQRREFLLFVPAACAVAGGPFVHVVEMCFAIPAALILAIQLRGAARAAAGMALCALAIPWLLVWASKKLFLAALFVSAAGLASLDVGLVAILTATACLAAALYALELRPPSTSHPSVSPPRIYAPGSLVSDEWRDYTAQADPGNVFWILVKLPTWSALSAVLAIAYLGSRRYGRRPITPVTMPRGFASVVRGDSLIPPAVAVRPIASDP